MLTEIPAFLLDALRFQDPRREHLRKVTDSEWEIVLSHWHVIRLTLPLRLTCGDELPGWVRERIDGYLTDNARRFVRVKTAYSQAAEALQEAGAEHVVLKGFSMWPGYSEHPRFRPQSDIDLYCPPKSIFCARDALLALGYTQSAQSHHPSDHLAVLNPPGTWEWRGNHFDPEIPISIELHYRLWNRFQARFQPKGLEQFWNRRIERTLEDLRFVGFDPADNLAYAAVNLLRDLLLGQPAPEQVYGLARFLDTHARDHEFWERWRELHDVSLRRLEAISFQLASHWFACKVAGAAKEEMERLPSSVHGWFHRFSASAQSTHFPERKDGVWLHLCLVESWGDKASVLNRRLFPIPIRVPTFASALREEAPALKEERKGEEPSLAILAQQSLKYIGWGLNRAARHCASLPRVFWRGLGFKASTTSLTGKFWTFLAASFCFDLGMTMFFFLYNLFLLERGFKEDFLGMLVSAMSIGSIASTIPAGIMVQRLGLRKSMLTCLALVSAVSVARTLLAPRLALLLFALLSGFVITIWAVAISPAITRLTSEENRPLGFSVVFSSGIAVGILASLAASRLPGWLMRVNSGISADQSKQAVLIMASAIVALGLLPLSRLNFSAVPDATRKVFPRNPFLLRFLVALALWSLVTGSLSPLSNVYLARYLQMPLERIGVVSAFSSLIQVVGILAAPFLFKKLGLVQGIASTQLGAAVMLGMLALVSAATPASVIYVGFTGLAWMSEPGLFGLLMSKVVPAEQAGASALNFLVTSVAQALAVAATGVSLFRFGYPPVLGAVAGVAVIAALSFWLLLGKGFLLDAKPTPASLDL